MCIIKWHMLIYYDLDAIHLQSYRLMKTKQDIHIVTRVFTVTDRCQCTAILSCHNTPDVRTMKVHFGPQQLTFKCHR